MDGLLYERIDDAELINGTSLRGTIEISYWTLVSTFGLPDVRDGSKVQVRWCLRFVDGTIATIYDWKQQDIPEVIDTWNIGGCTRRAVHLVCAVLNLEHSNVYYED